jgi:DNA polymerase I-like protein with 3'-5' exonuclease and polymerase domains
MGIRRFIETAAAQYGIDLTEDEAQRLKKQWLDRWPEMRLWFDFMSRRLGARQTTTIEQYHPRGEPHRVRGMCGYSDGLNTLFQGLVADGVKTALFNLALECYVDVNSPLYGSRPVFVVHDETIVEVPSDRASAAAKRHAEVMRLSLQEWLPDVPVTCSPALTKRLYKGPETVYDANGEVTVWEPPQH